MRSCLLLLVAATSLVLASVVQAGDVHRQLMQTRKERREQEREADALDAYYTQQATLNKEQESMLLFGAEEAVTIVEKVEKANGKKQIRIFTDLWENAKGITIVKTLAILNDRSPEKMEDYHEINSEAMERAESSGYSFKVSEALYIAMAVTDSNNDHYHLLDALIYRMNVKNTESKGSGCQYIEFLFTDAEAWAIDEGRAQQFFQGFDNEIYLPLIECFLSECKGTAAKCCSDKEATTSGLCACKVIDKKENIMQCDYNLFWTAPRTIWLCSTQECQPDEKCLCPDKKKGKKGKSKGKDQDSEEEETKKKKKSNEDAKDAKKKNKKGGKKTKKASKKSKNESSKKGNDKT